MVADDKRMSPVEFYFQVQFHWGTRHAAASFMEVSGLNQEMVMQEVSQSGDDGQKIRLPMEVKHGDIMLKRPLEPLSDAITDWVKRCFSFAVDGRITPCTLVVFLMDARRHAVACWSCDRAYPVKWSLGTLDAKESGRAVETLTLTYKRLERKK